MSQAIRGSKGSTIQDLPIGGIDTEDCKFRRTPYTEESDTSDCERNEDSSRDKSPVMNRSIVFVTYRETTVTAVKYRKFDPVGRPFPRSITFVKIFLTYIGIC